MSYLKYMMCDFFAFYTRASLMPVWDTSRDLHSTGHVQPGSMAGESQHCWANREMGVDIEMLLSVDHYVENSERYSMSS